MRTHCFTFLEILGIRGWHLKGMLISFCIHLDRCAGCSGMLSCEVDPQRRSKAGGQVSSCPEHMTCHLCPLEMTTKFSLVFLQERCKDPRLD